MTKVPGDGGGQRLLVPILLGDAEPAGVGDAAGGEDGLGEGLIHADRAGGHTAPHAGDTGQLGQPLDGAVLPVFAVKGGEDNIHLGAPPPRLAIKEQQAVVLPVGG